VTTSYPTMRSSGSLVVGDMSTDADEILTAYPGSPYDIRPPDQTGTLPPGHGALAIHAWRPRAETDAVAPIIGVDGKPVTYGFGRALVVVPAGERLVEVQEGRPRQTTPLTIDEGQVLEFEYSPVLKQARRGPQGDNGLLGWRPRRASNPWVSLTIGIVSVIWIVVAVGVTWADGVPAVGALAALLGLYGVWVGYSGWRGSQRPNQSKKRKGRR
jgi:hypothetical protein